MRQALPYLFIYSKPICKANLREYSRKTVQHKLTETITISG